MAAFTYIVTSYKEPQQIYRLLERLRRLSPAARIILSHDRKGPSLSPSILASVEAELHITPEPVYWGDDTYLMSVLTVLETLNPQPEGAWVTLLTAQDYPLRPLAEYEQFLSQGDFDMVLEEPPPSPALDGLLRRYRNRVVTVPAVLRDHPQLMRIARITARFLPGVEWAERPPGVPPCVELARWSTPFEPENGSTIRLHKGCDLFAINSRALSSLLSGNQHLLEYFLRTSIPSEAYFHTALLNDLDLVNCPRLIHYARWENSAHPTILDDRSVEELVESGQWFARKFSPDAPILDELDGAVLER